MAIYEGARPRTLLNQRRLRPADGQVLPRRRPSGGRQVEHRSSLVDWALVGIVVAFVLSFFYLGQTVRVSATGYELDRLASDKLRLEATLADIELDLNRLGRESAIRKLALDAGLGQLQPSIVLPAR